MKPDCSLRAQAPGGGHLYWSVVDGKMHSTIMPGVAPDLAESVEEARRAFFEGFPTRAASILKRAGFTEIKKYEPFGADRITFRLTVDAYHFVMERGGVEYLRGLIDAAMAQTPADELPKLKKAPRKKRAADTDSSEGG